MAELQLIGIAAIGKRQNLVPQADAEDGEPALQSPDGFNHFPHILGISGAVGQENAVGLQVKNLLHRGIVGNHRHIAAELVQAADDVQLHAAVNGHYVVFGVRRPGIPALFAADPGNRVPGHRRTGNDLQRLRYRGFRGGDQNSPGAEIPNAPGELPGIDAGDAGNAVFLQQLGEGLYPAEVGGGVVIVIAHNSADAGEFALVVILCHTIVADQGIGHHHHLVGIAQVGYDFLVAGHGGVENDFTHPVRVASEAVAVIFAAVLQDELPVD